MRLWQHLPRASGNDQLRNMRRKGVLAEHVIPGLVTAIQHHEETQLRAGSLCKAFGILGATDLLIKPSHLPMTFRNGICL